VNYPFKNARLWTELLHLIFRLILLVEHIGSNCVVLFCTDG